MNRHIYTLLVFIALGLLKAYPTSAQEQPNILWIITDDQRADALRCYNQATNGQNNSPLGYVESPNIDQLAAEGVLFTKAYCNSPACAPSRSSMHTGQYPHHSGRYGFEQTHTEHDLNKRTVPQILRDQGYGTAHFGKTGYYIFGWGPGQSYNRLPFYDLYIDHQGDLARLGFGDWSRSGDDETFIFPDGSRTVLTRGAYDGLTEAQKQARDEFDPRLDILRAHTRSNSGLILGGVSSQPASQTTDAYIVKEYLNYLTHPNRNYQTFAGESVAGVDTTNPVMIHLGFHFPHTPVLPPEDFRSHFQDKQYNIPEFDKSEVDRLPAQLKKHYEQMKIDEMSDADKQKLIQDYYAFCAYGDSLIGEAVRAFKNYCEANKQEYLIVLASGDHGWHLGEQGISAKFGPFDMSNHTAVVVVSSDKQAYPEATVRNEPLEYVDFAPTFYSAAGVDISQEKYNYLDGYDLAKVMDKSLPERDYVYGEMNVVYGPRAYIRSDEFAFSMRVRDKNNQPSASYPPNNNIMWALNTSREYAEMALYDLRVDAKERTNLAYTDEYIALADWFRTKLGNIALGDGRVEVIWSEINTWDVSNFAPGADDKILDIPPEIIPEVSAFSEINFQILKKKADTVAPLSNASIRIDSRILFTDSLGLAQGQVRKGNLPYTIKALGFKSKTDTIEFFSEQSLFQDTLEHEYYEVSLQFISEVDEVPVVGASVDFAGQIQVTDSEGKIHVDSLIYGEYSLQVSAPDFKPIENQLILVDKDDLISIELLRQTYTQTLVVQNQWDRSPVTGAALTINSQTISSDGDGEVNLELIPGSYPVKIEKDQYRTYTSSIETRRDSAFQFLLYQEIADVKFRVRSNGSAVSGASIYLDGDTLKTSVAGIASAYDLKVDSTYNYSISHEGHALYSDELILHIDSLVQVNLTIASAKSASGIEQLRIFPNPTSSQLNIRGFGGSDRVLISDITGKTLLARKLEGPEDILDLSALPNGIYILQFINSGVTQKIIKN